MYATASSRFLPWARYLSSTKKSQVHPQIVFSCSMVMIRRSRGKITLPIASELASARTARSFLLVGKRSWLDENFLLYVGPSKRTRKCPEQILVSWSELLNTAACAQLLSRLSSGLMVRGATIRGLTDASPVHCNQLERAIAPYRRASRTNHSTAGVS